MTDSYVLPAEFRIVSGGQSGADQAGLDWALAHAIAHGGWCPKGRRSEEGPIDPRYQLVETPSASYLQRTEWNVRDSDATLVFTLTGDLDGGSRKTAAFAEKLGKPWMHMRPGVHPKFVATFLRQHSVKVLNVAGKRETAAPGVHAFVQSVLAASCQARSLPATAPPVPSQRTAETELSHGI